MWRQQSSAILGIATAAVVACSQPHRTDDKEPMRPPPPPPGAAAPAASAPAPGADGVLAERTGIQGPIRVEQRSGRRLLIIGSTIHAAVPWTAAGPDPAARDPLVELFRLARPDAKTALVIGLGSGRTATELAGHGLAVTAVELDPVVIELARAYFGYRGAAIAADGLAHLRASTTAYDLVLVDAFAGTQPPPSLVTRDALALLRERTSRGGVTALRMLAAPRASFVGAVERGLAHAARGRHYAQLLGSGLGDELQNLYLLASDAPLNWRDDRGLALWPVSREGARAGGAADPGGPARRVTLVGYLHRTGDGALALDLAHWEMGATRYVLANAPDRLGAALPAGVRFPTQGDIASDGDTSATQRWLLGGGGVKRSDVRFSPVVAAVTGTARLISVIHPDAASALPADARGKTTDDRLPWGGALYRLEVSDVHWILDPSAGRQLSTAMTAALAGAARRAAAGELAALPEALDQVTAAFAPLGAQATLVPSYRQLVALRRALTAEQARAQRGGFAAAAACDRMRERVVRGGPNGELVALRHGFETCAVTGYERVADRDTPDGHDAAARLLYLLDPVRSDQASDAAKRRGKLHPKLQKRFGGLALEVPPRWAESQAGDQIQ